MRQTKFIIALCLLLPIMATAQEAAPEVTAEEQALCRPDAIRLCFFKLGNAEKLRACLRKNKEDLSAPCLGLIESRGN
jgi:hypothetical protein